MRTTRARGGAAAMAAAIWLWAACGATGARVVLWIQVTNPIEKAQTKEIRSALPARVGTNDIISLGGLDLGYDVKTDTYYAQKTVELGPKETREFRVELRDIWSIPEETLEALRTRAEMLAEKLAKAGGARRADYGATVEKTKERILRVLAAVKEHQEAHAIKPGVKPSQHLAAYESNEKSLREIRRDIGHLETLALGAGIDPGGLTGEVKGAPRPDREVEPEGVEYRLVVFRIVVENPSPAEPREVDIRRHLPEEIRMEDVVDGDGLEVGRDPALGLCFVQKEKVEIPPGGRVVFHVRIRDRWDVNRYRFPGLRGVATNLLETVGTKGSYTSIEEDIRGLLGRLDAIERETVPRTFNTDYVIFFREQAARIDRVEEKLNAIRSLLRPAEKTTKMGFKAKPPSEKTTWLIIYIILVFLAVMSILFFARWYGRGKDERMGSR